MKTYVIGEGRSLLTKIGMVRGGGEVSRNNLLQDDLEIKLLLARKVLIDSDADEVKQSVLIATLDSHAANEELDATILGKQQYIEDLDGRIVEMERSALQLETRIEELNSDGLTLTEQVSETEKKLADTTTALQEAEEKLAAITNELSDEKQPMEAEGKEKEMPQPVGVKAGKQK